MWKNTEEIPGDLFRKHVCSEGGAGLLKNEQKQTGVRGGNAHTNIRRKKNKKTNVFAHQEIIDHTPEEVIAGNHTSVRRIEIVDSSEPAAAEFLLYLSI